MELKEIKKIVAYAKKSGLKSMTVNGLEFVFQDEIVLQQPKRVQARAAELPRAVTEALAKADAQEIPVPKPAPTLDEINNFIYGDTANPN